MSKKIRLCITPKDISIVMDISIRQAHRRYQQLKDAHMRDKHQHVTVREFAAYFGLPLDEVNERL